MPSLIHSSLCETDYNELSGTIPSELGDNLKLERLELGKMNVAGVRCLHGGCRHGGESNVPYTCLFVALYALPYTCLWIMTSVGNKLVGSIPSELGRLTLLEKINICTLVRL